MQSYYEILGVSERSSREELKAAYKKLVRKYHPDVWGNEDKFRQVTQAYEALMNPKDVFVKRGDDIYTDVVISSQEAATGTTRTVNIMQSVQCVGCEEDNECPACKGMGSVQKHKKIKFKIPKNVKTGYKLRIKGEGHEGSEPGAAGDLFLTIHIEGRSKIRYDGSNILYSLALEPYQAVLGAKVFVPAYDGQVQLVIPPMTNSGQTF